MSIRTHTYTWAIRALARLVEFQQSWLSRAGPSRLGKIYNHSRYSLTLAEVCCFLANSENSREPD